MSEKNKAHDEFTADIVSENPNVIQILKTGLEKEISEVLLWDSLKKEDGTFVTKELSKIQSDALFSIKTKRSSKLEIYILFEHKSYVDKNIHTQLGGYLMEIYRKQTKPKLVLPFVLYHGKNNWNIKPVFIDNFDLHPDDLKLFSRYFPNFEFSLMDLGKTDVNELDMSLGLKSMMFALKYIWDLNSDESLKAFILLLKDLFFAQKEQLILERIIVYLYTSSKIKPERLEKIISEVISSEKAGIAMSTAELLREEGIEKKEREIVINMFSEGLSSEQIANYTHLPLETIIEIEKEK